MAKLYNQPPITKPPLDPKPGANAGLGEKIETTFTRFIQRVILWSSDFIAELFTNIFDASMKILKPGAMRMFEPLLTQWQNDPNMPPEIKAMIGRVKSEQGEAGILGILLTVFGIASALFGGALNPISRRLEHITDVLVRSYVPSPNELATFNRLGLIDAQVYQRGMWNNGVPEYFKPAIEELTRNIPNVSEIIAGKWRGIYNEGEFNAVLKRLGYDDKGIALFNELSKLIPPISDQIHFLVREAYNDDAASKFGYDADYPGELDAIIKKIGYDPAWAKRYWRAHWTLPSPTMAYDMLHRGIIDEQTLNELLKTADYPTFWRDKLMKVSYHNLTRVDLRRLAQAGMIDKEKVLKTYKALGYNDEDANLLTDFAMSGITQDERDLTRTDIINLYEEGLTDRGATQSALVKMGYDNDEADKILKIADVNIAKAARLDKINYVKERYLAKKIERNAATTELTQAGLSLISIDRYLMAWERLSELEYKIPSLADARRWYKADLIDETKFREYLKLNKYQDADINLYVREIKESEV